MRRRNIRRLRDACDITATFSYQVSTALLKTPLEWTIFSEQNFSLTLLAYAQLGYASIKEYLQA